MYTRKLSSVGNCLSVNWKDNLPSSFGEVSFDILNEVSEDTYKEAESFPYESRPFYLKPYSEAEKEVYKKKLMSLIGETFTIKVFKDFDVDTLLKEKGCVEFSDICYFAEVRLTSVK